MQQTLVELKNVSKVFKVGRKRFLHAVRDVSLDIYEGEILGLVGESGCGKSTVGRTIVKLYTQTEGSIQFRLGEGDSFSKNVQMIFQDPYSALNPRMTVGDIIAEGPDNFGMWSKEERNEKIGFWLERVGLHASHASRYPHEFSGGQRQRIGIARALAVEPKLVICDEPISALDVSVQAQVIHLLKDLQKERGLTYLFIAHDLSMVRVICDRMAVMYLGSIVELGTSKQVYESPKHPYTQSLIASNPIPDPRVEKAREQKMIEGEISSPINPKPGCSFAKRCSHAIEKCHSVTPELRDLGNNVKGACHLLVH